MSNRSHDWLEQARRDLALAEYSQNDDYHPSGAPFEHYGPLQSEEAINYAREIIEFVRNQMA